jgi:SAM-dependent methyltransferase
VKRVPEKQSSQAGHVPIQRGILPAPGQSLSAVSGTQAPFNLAALEPRDGWHYLCRQALQGNYLAPVALGKQSRILDVGTGTGRWAQEMALAFPTVAVCGLDLVGPPATTAHAPAPPIPINYTFQQGNILKRLPFLDQSFDLVHQRFVLAEIPWVQWYAVLCELVRVTRQGGWIELMEWNYLVLNAGMVTQRWLAWWEAEVQRSGLALAQISTLGALVQQVGLAGNQFTLDLPLGPWGGPLGELLQHCLLTQLEEVLQRASLAGNIPSDVREFHVHLPEEWQARKCQVRILLVLAEKKAAHG